MPRPARLRSREWNKAAVWLDAGLSAAGTFADAPSAPESDRHRECGVAQGPVKLGLASSVRSCPRAITRPRRGTIASSAAIRTATTFRPSRCPPKSVSPINPSHDRHYYASHDWTAGCIAVARLLTSPRSVEKPVPQGRLARDHLSTDATSLRLAWRGWVAAAAGPAGSSDACCARGCSNGLVPRLASRLADRQAPPCASVHV